MRTLKTADLMNACRCLKMMGIKDEIQRLAKAKSEGTYNGMDQFDAGFDIIWRVFDLATQKNAEKYIYEFLAGPFECTAKEVEDMEITTLFENLKKLAEENDLAGFFGLVLK